MLRDVTKFEFEFDNVRTLCAYDISHRTGTFHEFSFNDIALKL